VLQLPSPPGQRLNALHAGRELVNIDQNWGAVSISVFLRLVAYPPWASNLSERGFFLSGRFGAF
jgi:hypothetical protein